MVCCVDRQLCQVALRVLSGGLALVGLALVGLAAWAAVLGGEVAGLGALATVRHAARYPLWVALVGGAAFAFGLASALCVGRKAAKCFYCAFVPAMAAAALALATLLVGLHLAAAGLRAPPPPGGGDPRLVFFGQDLTPRLEGAWEDLVAADPQKACAFETSFRCAGFSGGDCGAGASSAAALDAEARDALYARCPGSREAGVRVTAFARATAEGALQAGGAGGGGGGPSAVDHLASPWDVRACLRAEVQYAADGCYRLATDLVEEWGTVLFVPGLCAAGYILLMALVAAYLTCCTCCWM